jgi:hypothetical protein
MAKAAAVFTTQSNSAQAGRDLGEKVRKELADAPPDALVVFASAQFDYVQLLTAIQETCRPAILVGSSSAGEFTGEQRGEGTACALAIWAPDMHFSVGLGRGVGADRAAAARDVIASFAGVQSHEYPYRAALVMTDALAGHADDLIEQLTLLTAAKYQFAGGGAGDDARFSRTHVFCGTEAHTDAVVALEMLSRKPLGVGVSHGWVPGSEILRVTEASGMRVASLNGMPAAEAFEEYARETGQSFDRAQPLPFFLHNILGIQTGDGYRLRVPLSVDDAGGVLCAAEIPAGASVRIMKTTNESAVAAAATAASGAVKALGGGTPGAALFFDCVATRLRLGDVFGYELESVARSLGGAQFVGCNTYGQIARGEGQFSGFHNCTAVLLVLPA